MTRTHNNSQRPLIEDSVKAREYMIPKIGRMVDFVRRRNCGKHDIGSRHAQTCEVRPMMLHACIIRARN